MDLTFTLLSKFNQLDMQVEHRDALGKLLQQGDCVAYPVQNTLMIGVITKVNKRMVRIKSVVPKRSFDKNRYPTDVVKLEGPEVSLFILKNSDAK